jgi:hypothetical protein
MAFFRGRVVSLARLLRVSPKKVYREAKKITGRTKL